MTLKIQTLVPVTYFESPRPGSNVPNLMVMINSIVLPFALDSAHVKFDV